MLLAQLKLITCCCRSAGRRHSHLYYRRQTDILHDTACWQSARHAASTIANCNVLQASDHAVPVSTRVAFRWTVNAWAAVHRRVKESHIAAWPTMIGRSKSALKHSRRLSLGRRPASNSARDRCPEALVHRHSGISTADHSSSGLMAIAALKIGYPCHHCPGTKYFPSPPPAIS